MTEQRRRGFCPRVWTPMQSGDGLLVRVHSAARWLHARDLAQLAALAERHGNGLIDLTRRANLQLRGVRPASLAALQAALVTEKLADPSNLGERRFALLVTPFLGLDPACAALAPVAESLATLLGGEGLPCDLHPKLAIVLDGPEASLAGVQADLYIALAGDRTARARAAAGFDADTALLSVAVSARERLLLGACALSEVASWVAGWLERLAEGPTELRMHEWVAAHGRDALQAAPETAAATSASVHGPALWGFQRARADFFGVMLPFGSGDAGQWRALAALAERYGDGWLRTHPERGLLLRGVTPEQAEALRAAALEAGLSVSHDDPLTRVVACPGAPSCSSAEGETRQLARELAPQLAEAPMRGVQLHVSGCEKSCAHSGPSAIVLVHTKAGARLAFNRAASDAASAAPIALASVPEALSASAREYATPAPDS